MFFNTQKKFFAPSVPFTPRKMPIYYGYIIVLAAIFAAIVTAPGQTIGVSVYTDYFIKYLHLSRTQLSLAYMIGTIGSATIIGREGVLIDKLGARFIGFWTIVFLGITLIFLSQLDKFAFLLPKIIVFLCMVLGFFALRFLAQGVLSLVSRTMLLKWFVNLRGRMTSIVGVFTTLSMSASPPVFNWLIVKCGWQVSYLIMGLIIAIACGLFFWLLARSTPEECGLITDGFEHKKTKKETEIKEQNWTVQEAKATYSFWIFNLSFAIYSLLTTAFTFHITSIFAAAGLSRHVAVTIFLPIAVIAIVVKLISGWLCDIEPWRSKLKYQLVILLLALGLLCIGIFVLKSVWGRDLVIISNGIATGFFVTLSAVSWPQFYGRKNLGAISGVNTAYRIFFSAIGPLFFALSVKLTGTYMSAIFLCFIVVMALSCLAVKADAPAYPG